MSKVRATGLVMSVEETRRDARTSEVKTVFKSGGSVGSAMFVVACVCDMARQRGVRYFVPLKEWSAAGGGTMQLIGFSDSKEISVREFFAAAEPLPMDKKFDFLSAEPGSLICEVGRPRTATTE